MTDAYSCDGPDCGNVATFTLGWWQLEPLGAMVVGGADRLHFCRWSCLIDFVAAHADEVSALEERLRGD